MRQLLLDLGYEEKKIENAHVFRRAKNDLVVFRRYNADEQIDWGDLVSTRRFLDMRGILDAGEFDSIVGPKVKPA
jgi:hypothetical protein